MPWFRRTRNVYRRLRRKPIGFVHLELKKEVPLFLEPKSFVEKRILPDPPYNFYQLWKDSKQLINDSRVNGLVIHLRSSLGGAADHQLLRNLITYWKDNGKPVWIYANNYNMLAYFLASATDKIFITQGGTLDTIGFNVMTTFFKDFLEERGIDAQVVQVTPYKAAFNSFVHNEPPEEQRENLEWIADSLYETVVSGIAEGREKSVEQTKAMIDASPLQDNQALDEGWIDGILSPHGIKSVMKSELGDKRLTDWKDAMDRMVMKKHGKPNIGVIPIVGTILDGESRRREYPIPLPILGEKTSGDLSVVQAIRKVREDKNFKAAILYVDSGGGSATSSEAMLAELGRLASEKPVFAYFNNVAASGGYYVAMNCQKIYVQDLTLTGSIGVINAKISTKSAYDERKINRFRIYRGKNSNIHGFYGLWDENQIEQMRAMIFRTYDIFKEHVSKNRDMSVEEVDKLAGGRIWTGKQARDHQLVDQIGSIFEVIEDLSEKTGVSNPVVSLVVDEDKSLVPEAPPMDIRTILKEIGLYNGKNMLILPYFIEFV